MKTICVFAASNSTKSMNRKLVTFAANRATSQLGDVQIDEIDLNDFEMPIYSPEREATGIPQLARDFDARIRTADGVIISFAEHNGSYTVAFKNVLDWVSRLEGTKAWDGKPMFLMATSPGGRGGVRVLDAAKGAFPHMGMNICSTFSLPSFYDNFKDGLIVDEVLAAAFEDALTDFIKAI